LQVFAVALKTWREKQRLQTPTTDCKDDVLNDSEFAILEPFIDATNALITRFSSTVYTAQQVNDSRQQLCDCVTCLVFFSYKLQPSVIGYLGHHKDKDLNKKLSYHRQNALSIIKRRINEIP